MSKFDESSTSNLILPSALLGSLPYGVAFRLLPPLSDRWSSVIYLCCIGLAYVVIKKLKQAQLHREGKTLSTLEDRDKWAKKQEKGFLRFIFAFTLDFCLRLSILVPLIALFVWYFNSKQMPARTGTELAPDLLKLALDLLSFFLIGGFAVGLFIWWDGRDNEQEWLRYQNFRDNNSNSPASTGPANGPANI